MHKFGWRPDTPDQRDHLYALPGKPVVLPSHFDWLAKCPPVYDQGQLGSCTGNAIAGALEVDRKRQNLADWSPSRLFIYYGERVMEGTVASDAGAEIRDGIKVVNRLGAPPETLWPYDIGQFSATPSQAAYAEAKLHPAVSYLRVQNTSLYAMRYCLALSAPVVIGISVYDSFEASTDGTIPMPSVNENLLGGHAILIVGYDDGLQRFIFRNSWGGSWGRAGYGTLPYQYLTNGQLAQDAWAITIVK